MDCSPPDPLSMEFSRQQYWSGLPFPSPGDLPNAGVNPGSPASQADSLPTELLGNMEGSAVRGDMGSIPGPGTKILHTTGQLSPHATTTKPEL